MLRWLPWRFFISQAARRTGFIDPITILTRLERFAQPAEVASPLELLRAGVVFHARGLINARVIQHNLDWVWPWWVERQFDPADESFIPRAFSITHVNLTHRNWVAIGQAGGQELPIVDPRGLVTPLLDGWSIDVWLQPETGGAWHFPSREGVVTQRLDLNGEPRVESCVAFSGGSVELILDTVRVGLEVELRGTIRCTGPVGGRLAVVLRPFNPEGISFLRSVDTEVRGNVWRINDGHELRFDPAPEEIRLSWYEAGDVAHQLDRAPGPERSVRCEQGMASAAALWRSRGVTTVEFRVPLYRETPTPLHRHRPWAELLGAAPRCRLHHGNFDTLFNAAVWSTLLLGRGEVWPGPSTYRRFWFRDACFMLHALLLLGFHHEVAEAIDAFPGRQRRDGYLLSQEGEWDSNGQVLWLINRYVELSGFLPKRGWLECVSRGARWIIRKRLSSLREGPYAGLLPAGFSAEHLGPNDYYYWDDFWGVAGLRAAAALMRRVGRPAAAGEFDHEAGLFAADLERSLEHSIRTNRRGAIPAAPGRRLDSGAIGSLAGGYPLDLLSPRDPRLLATAGYLHEHCLVGGGFFQEMIHSGINPYLTLQLAQVFLQAGDPRFLPLVETVARLASPTGQWPEAIHPRTGGGCMGDGHHGWASAEWIVLIHRLFIQERGQDLILGAGLVPELLPAGRTVQYGPASSTAGALSVSFEADIGEVRCAWQGEWRGMPPLLTIALPGTAPVRVDGGIGSCTITRPGG